MEERGSIGQDTQDRENKNEQLKGSHIATYEVHCRRQHTH